MIKFIQLNRICFSFVLLLTLSFAVLASPDESHLSEVDKVILEAKKLEAVDIKKAIEMMLKREKDITAVSSIGELATFYNKLSELHATIGHLKSQQMYAEKGLKLLGSEVVAIAADLNYNLGLAHEMRADFTQAQSFYRRGMAIAEQTGHLLYQGRGKLFIAAIHTNDGNYDLALKTIKEAYAFAEQLNDVEFSWEVNNQMGILYSVLGDEKRSLEFSLRALENSESIGIKSLMVVAFHNVALTYLKLEEFDNANIYFEKMLSVSKTSGELSDMYYSYKGFALVALKSKQYERALAYIDKAQQYLNSVEITLAQVEFYIIKAEALNKLEQSNRALQEIAIAEQILPREQRREKSRMGLRLLEDKSSYHAELGQYRRAYELLREYSEGVKVYEQSKNDEAVRKLRVSFDLERKEIRNNILEKDNKIKALQLRQADSERNVQNLFMFALALLTIVLIVVMYRQLQARRQLKVYAQTDALTGLYNRGYIFSKGDGLLMESQQQNHELSLLMFDVDHFKQINDQFGHPAGDQVLKMVSQLAMGCLRESDMLARVGGEEFMAVLPSVNGEMAEFIAGRIKDKLEQYVHRADHDDEQASFRVTASFGVATVKLDENFEQLVQRADNALYLAKEQGRNCICVSDSADADIKDPVTKQ